MAKKKVRVDFRKNRSKPPRDHQWTRGFQEHGFLDKAPTSAERVRAKGDLSRKRTIIQDTNTEGGEGTSVDENLMLPGRVLRVHNLFSIVESPDGRPFRCALRGVLRTMATQERNLVTCGDHVWFRPAVAGQRETPTPTDLVTPIAALPEGMIERVEPRHGVLTRASRGRKHVMVANVDQVVFVLSLIEPELKPHLIDRYLASADLGEVSPILCLNKEDLVDPAKYQNIVGFYSQLGVPTILTSVISGQGIEMLKEHLKGRQTVFSGQSGVGKSSLLNAIEPGLGLRVREVSDVNQKGKHTTTTSELIRLELGGWVVDTPGVRQFELWKVRPEEVEGFFADIRPFVPLCGYADCTHSHEDRCAVKRALIRRQISASRYHSYMGLLAGEPS